MSAYTTLYISRNKARDVLRERIEQLTDNQLESFVDTLTEPQLYRNRIDSEGSDDDKLARALD